MPTTETSFFKVGTRLRNLFGAYEILAISGGEMKVRYDNGKEQLLNIETQGRIFRRLEAEENSEKLEEILKNQVPVKKTKTASRAAPKTPRGAGTIQKWFDPEALKTLVSRFEKEYESFESQNYLETERDYKIQAAKKLAESLNREILKELIDKSEFDQVKERIKTTIKNGAGNANFTLVHFIDPSLFTPVPAPELARAFFELLYGESPFSNRFTNWVELLSRQNGNSWSLATCHLMLFDPAHYLMVKPESFKKLLKALKSDLQLSPKPDFKQYSDLLTLAEKLKEALGPLKPADLLDIQSFSWVLFKRGANS